MSFTLLNGLLLLGLFAVAIPPIIHLLNRKRFDIVDWAAMQFLQISEQTRRKILLEELLLMLLRMGLIALMVLALAAPVVTSSLFAKLGTRSSRDVVLVFDGSDSMNYKHEGKTADRAARNWAKLFLQELEPGDGVAVLQAKSSPVVQLESLSPDREKILSAIETLPAPRGNADWPAAVRAAVELLNDSKRLEREIFILSDGQRNGWADPATLARWAELGKTLTTEGQIAPRIWVVNTASTRPADALNWALSPITASRPVAAVGRPKPGKERIGSEVRFKTAMRLTYPRTGEKPTTPPNRIRLEVDGGPAGEIRTFAVPGESGQIPLDFKQRFMTVGSHLVSALIDDDPMPGDNRQDFALIALPSIPVLLVDGDRDVSVRRRGSDFLKAALAPDADEAPAFQVKQISVSAFEPDLLTRPLDQAGTVPQVLILSNVDRLSPPQEAAIEKFLQTGGGVLVTLGDRPNAEFYNTNLFRNAQGWLPTRLVEALGDPNDLDNAARPVTASFTHPAFELFRGDNRSDLDKAYFPRHWRLEIEPQSPATAIAQVEFQKGKEPWFAERIFGKGRVIVCSVPLDSSWCTNLVNLYDFPRLAHELMYWLAGTRSAELNLLPKQPIVFRPLEEELFLTATTTQKPKSDLDLPCTIRLQPPSGEEKEIRVTAWPMRYEDTRETGVYKLTTPNGRVYYYVVQPDAAESVLQPASESELAAVANWVPGMIYANEISEVTSELNRSMEQQELWWLFMLAVIVLLASEVWFTRRIALASGAAVSG